MEYTLNGEYMNLDIPKLESFIFEKMSKTKLPGLSIAIVKDDEVIYSRGFGFRDVENGLHATPNTIYGIGSVTKSFTCLAIMQLVEKGLLSLEDPIYKYVDVSIKPFNEEIKVWHLMTHSSGIPALAYAEALIRSIVGDDATWVPIASPEDIISFIKGAENWVESRPGERFFYLNEGYVVLGKIIEKVSGKRYVDYVKEKILVPLEMNRSYFLKEELDKDPEVAKPYVITKDGKRIKSTYPYGITADGGLFSNVLDLTHYILMYLNRGTYRDKEILSKGSIEEMEKGRIDVPFRFVGGEKYGYGWLIVPDFLGYKLVCHSGSILVSTAYVGYIPEVKIGVALLSNGSGYPLSYIGMYALALALGKDPERELPFIRNDRILDKLTGTYETYRGTVKARVVRRGDMLYIEMGGKYTATSVPLVPKELSEDVAHFIVPRLTGPLEVEFRVKDHEIILIYERYKFKKLSA